MNPIPLRSARPLPSGTRSLGQSAWWPLVFLLLGSACAPQAASGGSATFYISPAGSDWNGGRDQAKPFRTFAHAFGKMRPGDTLILLDGEYSEAAKTGYVSYRGEGSAQPPSGAGPQAVTRVRALHPGKARVSGKLFLGRSFRKDSYIAVEGIHFSGGGHLYNTSYVTIKECGFDGPLAVGTNDHHEGNSYNLIEDVWVRAAGERIIAINYRSHYNVWRRVLVRGDGCGTAACAGRNNPNVGITVYDSHDVSLQNVMVIDRILLASDSPYADFAVAQHTADERYYFGRNEWLGTISLNAPDTGYYMEPDAGHTLDPTVRIVNAVAWNARHLAFNLARAGTNNLIENITALSINGDAVRIAPVLRSGILRNVLVAGAARYGINSAYPPSFAVVHGVAGLAYNQTRCATGCYATNPRADGRPPSLRYLTRIEPGSRLKGKGYDGNDIGANIVYRYGVDGARFGEPGYNTLSNVPLWPWPNEDRIKAEMCRHTDRGFCTPGQRLDGVNPVTLTSYVWEQLGERVPQEIYPGR